MSSERWFYFVGPLPDELVFPVNDGFAERLAEMMNRPLDDA